MRLEEIEEGERLLAAARKNARDTDYPFEAFEDWLYTTGNIDALIAAAKAAAWRPINTAEKTEEIIDLICGGERYPECWWSGERWISYIAGNRERQANEPWFEVVGPTHWRPIGPLPEEG